MPCGAGSTVQGLTLILSVIILASLLVLSMLGCRHSLLLYSSISRFPLVVCTFLNIPTYAHLQVLVLLAFTFRYRVVLQGHLLFLALFKLLLIVLSKGARFFSLSYCPNFDRPQNLFRPQYTFNSYISTLNMVYHIT